MENHDLHHEFPQYEEKIHELKMNDNHFRKLFDDYHHTNKEIHRLESSNIYIDDELNSLKSNRLHLKDQIFNILRD